MPPFCTSPEMANCRKRFRRRGFTLIETLTVAATFAVLLALAVPAVTGMKRGQTLGRQVETLSSTLEQARTLAVSRNTFVWVGIHEKDENGVPVVIVSTVAGLSGQASDLANSRFRPALKPLHLHNTTLDASGYADLPGLDAVNNQDIEQSSLSFHQTIGSEGEITFDRVIVFNPGGGARISEAFLSRLIGIGLAAGPVTNGTDVAALQISGLNGNISVYRR